MGMLCAVTFTSNGQLHYASPGELRPEVGDMVLLPTEHGSVAARVVWAAEYSAEDTDGFPMLLGMATDSDLAATEQLRKTKARTMVASRKLIREHGLPMKVLAVDPQPGSGKTVIYYSSPETVDFRSLLRDLSATLGTRIELRQLAARDSVRSPGRSAPAAGIPAARRSSRTSNRSPWPWPAIRTCRPTPCAFPAHAAD